MFARHANRLLRRAWSPLGARLSPQCPAQCSETAEGAAARVVAAGGPALAIVICKAMVVTGCESHCHGCGQDVRALCLCTTAIVISIVLVLAGSESQCKRCEKDVCEVCLCTGAIVICRTSVCAAGESPCKCCIEVEYPSACTVSVHYCHCDFHSIGSCRFGVAVYMLREGCLRSVSVHWCHCDLQDQCLRGMRIAFCGARGRRWVPGSLRSVRRSVQRLQKGLRRAWSPLGARLSPL